ncbi:TPA: acetylornithine transaminase [Candidatus Woesearchaeota archaeon]|nr:acetylornithine transaminase [Candidatus Woesearchaeota archaeon]HII68988.1 acetylornithine transaminase [Candidatus Woesearchaeota archaeon]
MNTQQIITLESKHVMSTYRRFPVAMVRGNGAYVYDAEGKKYLDMLGGIAVTPVGHANKEVAKAVSRQIKTLTGVSNYYYMQQQAVLAAKLAKKSGLARCFFCNSGAEANEAAFKLVRKVTGKKEIISFVGAFHGRTFGSLAATWKSMIKDKFVPLVPMFKHVPYGDLKALESAITSETAAVIMEPIQGEAGINVSAKRFLVGVRAVCTKRKVLLIMDEVQTGIGRTGAFFAYQHAGIVPDIVTTAKGLANGIPIGVCIAAAGIDFDPGDHASTFGGNEISCAAANAVLDYIDSHDIMSNAANMGALFMKKLAALKEKKQSIREIRGMGLMIALELDGESKPVVVKCLENGLICNAVTEKAIRFLPPLIITEKELDIAINILDEVLR